MEKLDVNERICAMIRIAFICTHNSCRSQIAEAFAKALASDVFEGYSAGTAVKDRINPDAVRLMKQHYSIDMEKEGQHPKMLDELPPVDGVITMGCGVQCPYLPSKWREDWGLEDPTGKSDEAFLKTMEEIRLRVIELKDRLEQKYMEADMTEHMTADESLTLLKKGNNSYLNTEKMQGDVSPEIRQDTALNGQNPYAIIIACSDSRVIPEAIFSAGIGDLFTIRVAGNVIDDHQLGSVEYAAAHLHCPLTVVLGHTHCGAVGAAISGNAEGYIASITDEIKKAIGDEKDDLKASELNVRRNVFLIQKAFQEHSELSSMKVIGAVYDIETGKVEWL